MRNLPQVILIGSLLLNACSSNRDATVSVTQINGKTVPFIQFSKITDTITLNLSQLFKNVSFIKLETTVDNKLAGGKWSIGEKYIVGYVRRTGFFQFSSKGKFIRKLANYGKGPQEVYYPNWTVSKDESQVIIYDLLKPKNFLCFDLNSGLLGKDIPIALEGQLKNISFANDSVLICAPIIGTGTPAGNNYLFYQNLSGQLINTVVARTESKPIVPVENLLYLAGDQFHYRPINSDTIFKVNGYQIEPVIVFDADNSSISTPDEIGRTNINISIETSDFFIIQTDKIISKDVIGENTIGYTGTKKNFYFDKLRNRAYLVSSFTNDFTGQKLEPTFFEDQFGNIKYVSVETISLLNRIKALRNDPQIKVKDRKFIIDLGEGMTENDNPVLITGTFKK